MRIILRLEFENVYPEEESKEITEYLNSVSRDILLRIIGFSNTYPQPNYDTIFSNPKIKKDIIYRVNCYCIENNITDKPELISREASLKLAEIILSNKDNLLKDNDSSDTDIDANELNLFKAYLIINKEVNKKEKLSTSENSEDRVELAQMMITMFFSISDIGVFDNNHNELLKLIYCTIVKFELLVKFLQSNSDYSYLEERLFKHFNTKSVEDLKKHVKSLFFNLLRLEKENSFTLLVENEDYKLFLNSLVSNSIIEDDDFTNLKNHPMYKINEKTYSIIDSFFVVDKFYKSVRFILKEIFNKEKELSTKDRTFFNFFNTKFSEEFLMKDILDKLFIRQYFVKKLV
ncbi:MAG: hypothetical protein LBQ84_03150, partial [Flavobacteriaceae bacterium]|nr:hypothetical protein [Flavobacteriaceae bacterium]